MLWAQQSGGSNPGSSKKFLSSIKHPEWLWGTHKAFWLMGIGGGVALFCHGTLAEACG